MWRKISTPVRPVGLQLGEYESIIDLRTKLLKVVAIKEFRLFMIESERNVRLRLTRNRHRISILANADFRNGDTLRCRFFISPALNTRVKEIRSVQSAEAIMCKFNYKPDERA